MTTGALIAGYFVLIFLGLFAYCRHRNGSLRGSPDGSNTPGKT